MNNKPLDTSHCKADPVEIKQMSLVVSDQEKLSMCPTDAGVSLQLGVNLVQDISKSFAMVIQALKKLHFKGIVFVVGQGPMKQYISGGEMPKPLLCISSHWNVILSKLRPGLWHLI